MKVLKNHPEIITFAICSLFLVTNGRHTFLENFKCVYNNGRVSGIDYMIQRVGGVTTKAVAFKMSALQCGALCIAKGPTCVSYGYNVITHQCFLYNLTARVTGRLCGRWMGDARYRPMALGSTYITYGGTNKILMECMSGACVSDYWPIRPLSADSCFNLCNGGLYPCLIFFGVTYSCQSCMHTNSMICETDHPFLANNSTRGLCSPIY